MLLLSTSLKLGYQYLDLSNHITFHLLSNSVVSEIMGYPRCHLLGLPVEIRMAIWRCIYDDILAGNSSCAEWYELQTTCWSGLQATSRTIYHETLEFWPRTMIPHDKKNSSLDADHRIIKLAKGLSISSFKNFRHLSIQLPIQQDQNPGYFFRSVAAGLLQLAPVLQDLRMFFLGDPNFLGCGLRVYSVSEDEVPQRLLHENDCYSERSILFRALEQLQFLHNLVLSNVNYPLLHSLIGYKPMLKTLLLLTDSRSVLYKHSGGPLVTWYPPAELQTLHISANAVLGAVNVVLKVLHSLQNLTYVIPSKDWQVDKWAWLDDASTMLQRLAFHAKNLRKFRFCVEEVLRDEQETAAKLIGALRQYLPHTRLEVFEIHATIHSDYFGHELIEALPNTLKRLYISQELIVAEELVQAVRGRYFRRAISHQNAGNLGFVGFEYEERESTKSALLRLNGELLERERNAHLFDDRDEFSYSFGDGSSRVRRRAKKLYGLEVEELGEDLLSVEHAPHESLLQYEDQTIKHITEAEMVFHAENTARSEDRLPYLLIPDNVEVGENEHWMSD